MLHHFPPPPKMSWQMGTPMLPSARHTAKSPRKAQATFYTHWSTQLHQSSQPARRIQATMQAPITVRREVNPLGDFAPRRTKYCWEGKGGTTQMMAKQRGMPELKKPTRGYVRSPWDLEQSLRQLFSGEDGTRPSSAKGFSLLSPPVHTRISPVALV